MARVIAFLIQNITSPSKAYSFPIPGTIQKAMKAFFHSLQWMSKSAVGGALYDDLVDANEIPDDDEDYLPDDLPLPEVTDDLAPLDDDIHADDIWDTSANELYLYGMSEKRPAPSFNDDTQKMLCQLLKLLYTENPNDAQDNPFRSIFVCFVVLSSPSGMGVIGRMLL
jgi:hypothetical protein